MEDHVTGIEAKADSRPIYHLAAPHFLELPNVGTLKEFDLEGAAALNPDLIILSVRLKDCLLYTSCNETDKSAEVSVNIAVACNATQFLAKPGMGVDEGLMIVNNEMNRVIALANRGR